jgi:hypothetical protein
MGRSILCHPISVPIKARSPDLIPEAEHPESQRNVPVEVEVAAARGTILGDSAPLK